MYSIPVLAVSGLYVAVMERKCSNANQPDAGHDAPPEALNLDRLAEFLLM